MKCINKYLKCLLCLVVLTLSITSCAKSDTYVTDYETKTYNKDLFQGTLHATDLCVSADNVALNNYSGDASLHAAALFDVNKGQVYYAQNIHEKLYPASTTKIMTAYVALKYGNLTDMVTVSPKATDFGSDSSLCGLLVGDQLTLEDLLNGLLLYSGNDNAVAIAEHISGSEEAFTELMNKEAKDLGATNTHFANSHGLHDVNHYTTAYDLYLMFNECLKDERFINIISKTSYPVSIQNAITGARTDNWPPTHYYATGLVDAPANVTVVGGKTGTTDEAGNCVVLMEKDAANNMYISIIMGAPDKTVLYNDMTALITALPNN